MYFKHSLFFLSTLLLVAPSRGWCAELPFTFSQAAERSLKNPRILAGQQAQRSLEEAASRLPTLDANPVLSIQLGARIAPVKERNPEGAASLSQPISLERSARVRRNALSAETKTAEVQEQNLRLQFRLAAAQAWLDLWAAQRLHELAQQDAAAARQLQQAVERLVRAQERTRSEALVAKRQAEEAALRVLAAEGKLVEARERLKAELGLSAEDSPLAVGDPPDVVPPSAERQQAVLVAAASLPAVRIKSLLVVEENLRAMEERAARGSWITVGVQAQRDAIGATAILGQLSTPIPLLNLSGREEAPRRAAALRAQGDAEDALRRARSELALAFHDLEHSEQVERSTREELLPTAEQANLALGLEFQAGEATLLERLDGQRALLDARARQITALRDRAWARIRASILVNATQSNFP